jgi:hypothetical protein
VTLCPRYKNLDKYIYVATSSPAFVHELSGLLTVYYGSKPTRPTVASTKLSLVIVAKGGFFPWLDWGFRRLELTPFFLEFTIKYRLTLFCLLEEITECICGSHFIRKGRIFIITSSSCTAPCEFSFRRPLCTHAAHHTTSRLDSRLFAGIRCIPTTDWNGPSISVRHQESRGHSGSN